MDKFTDSTKLDEFGLPPLEDDEVVNESPAGNESLAKQDDKATDDSAKKNITQADSKNEQQGSKEETSEEDLKKLADSLGKSKEESSKEDISEKKRQEDRDKVFENTLKKRSQEYLDAEDENERKAVLDKTPRKMRELILEKYGFEDDSNEEQKPHHSEETIEEIVARKLKEQEEAKLQQARKESYSSKFLELSKDVPAHVFKEYSEAVTRIAKEEGQISPERLVMLAKIEAGIGISKKPNSALPPKGKGVKSNPSIDIDVLKSKDQKELTDEELDAIAEKAEKEWGR